MPRVRSLRDFGKRLEEVVKGAERTRWQRLTKAGSVVAGIGTYGFPEVHPFIFDDVRLIVGNYCSLANSATFLLGGEHSLDRTTTFPFRIRFGLTDAGTDGFPKPTGNTVLGSDVWVGARALILSGCRIGHGAVVAGGAVVTRDVPPYAVVGGNPARVLGFRLTEEQRRALLRIEWWNWPEERVRRMVPFLSGPDVDAFIALADTEGALDIDI